MRRVALLLALAVVGLCSVVVLAQDDCPPGPPPGSPLDSPHNLYGHLLQPDRCAGEEVWSWTSPVATIQPSSAINRPVETDFWPLDMPPLADDLFVLKYSLVVLTEDLEYIDLKTPENQEQWYFHHSVIHEKKIGTDFNEMADQMMFLSSADMINTTFEFADGYGMWVTPHLSTWQLCWHVMNKVEEFINFRLHWSIIYKPFNPDEHKVVITQFLGRKFQGRLPTCMNNEDFLMRGTLSGGSEPGHGSMELVKGQWHLHSGCTYGIFSMTTDNSVEVISEITVDSQNGPATNGIDVIELKDWGNGQYVLPPGPENYLTITVDSEIEPIHEDLHDQNPLMYYILLYVHYSDNTFKHMGKMAYLSRFPNNGPNSVVCIANYLLDE